MPNSSELKDFFGNSTNLPQHIANYGPETGGIIILFSNITKVAIYASLIFAALNFLTAGIQYIGSSGNPEVIKQASSRIWISLLGLVVAASSLVIAGIIGLIFFGNALAIIQPAIYGP